MNKNLSAYLDFSRFSAAVLVFCCHLDESWVRGLFPFFTHLGLEAVGVFFVLSGYVIGYVTHSRENNFFDYAINRAARIYSVVIPCLLMTFLLDVLGRHIWQNHYYHMNINPDDPHSVTNIREAIKLLASLTFFNQIWHLDIAPGSNVPFWSLCYEVPYYIIFASMFFIKNCIRWIVFSALCILAGPKIISLFPLWLLGYSCFCCTKKINLSPGSGQILFAVSIATWCACEMTRWHYAIGTGSPKGGTVANLWQFYIAGVPFALSIIGFNFADIKVHHYASTIRWLAGATFTLYLLHYPVAIFVTAALPAQINLLPKWIITFAVVICSTLVLAEFTERRKKHWRNGLEVIVKCLIRTRSVVLEGRSPD